MEQHHGERREEPEYVQFVKAPPFTQLPAATCVCPFGVRCRNAASLPTYMTQSASNAPRAGRYEGIRSLPPNLHDDMDERYRRSRLVSGTKIEATVNEYSTSWRLNPSLCNRINIEKRHDALGRVTHYTIRRVCRSSK
jgi:hypothetical protein